MRRKLPSMRHVVRFVLAQAAVVAVTAIAVEVGANATTAGFAFLIAILGVAVTTTLVTALTASAVAVVLYNFFFFQPIGTLTIDQPANWVALISFFIASVGATRLVVHARTQAEQAEARRREIETLYALSVDLFTATNGISAVGEASTRALTSAGAAGGGLVLFGKSTYDQKVASWIGPKPDEIEDLIAGVGRHNRPLEFPAIAGRDVYLPLRIGGDAVGVLCARATTATLSALESAGTLVALAVERQRLLAESAHMQVLEEGDALKTSLLRAVSHDLATPLTAVTMQIDRLRVLAHDPVLSEVVEDIAEHTGRLRRRIENLLAMARLEARSVLPHAEPTPAADLFRSVREHLPLVAHARGMEIRVTSDCPDAYVDPSLALEILANLIENAHQASPAGAAIELSAFPHPLDSERVRLEVADRGPGLRADFASEASDTPRRGLGLEIARSLAGASGGHVTLTNRDGGGAVAYVDLPVAHLPLVEDVAT